MKEMVSRPFVTRLGFVERFGPLGEVQAKFSEDEVLCRRAGHANCVPCKIKADMSTKVRLIVDMLRTGSTVLLP